MSRGSGRETCGSLRSKINVTKNNTELVTEAFDAVVDVFTVGEVSERDVCGLMLNTATRLISAAAMQFADTESTGLLSYGPQVLAREFSARVSSAAVELVHYGVEQGALEKAELH